MYRWCCIWRDVVFFGVKEDVVDWVCFCSVWDSVLDGCSLFWGSFWMGKVFW